MAFPDTFLDELTARMDIVEFVSRYVALKRRGSSLLGLCPFHAEKTPSFTVSPDKQLYYCFGCHAGGGVIQFAMQVENMAFSEAVHLLADQAGLQVPDDQTNLQERHQRERQFSLHVAAARFFNTTLREGGNPEASVYLQRRGLTPATIRNFGLGAAPPYGSQLLEAMTAAGYTKAELLAGGLIAQNNKGEVYDRFRNRLMFPILNVQKKVIAFGGRILGEGQPKYLNSPDTPIFSKSRNLFALNFAKNSKHKGLILAEGYMDVISLHQAGFDHAVASLGTSLTEQQVQLMRKYAEEVILAYDTDSAGRAAAERATKLLQKADIKVSMLLLEGAKDPDEFIQKFGAAALTSRLEQRENHMDYRIGALAATYDLHDDQGRVGFLKEGTKLLAGVSSDVEREVYCGKVAGLAAVSPEAVRLEVKKLRGAAYKRAHRQEEQKVRAPARQAMPPGATPNQLHAARAEEELIILVLQDPSMLDSISDRLTLDDFATPFLGRIWEQLVVRYETGAPVTMAALTQYLSPEEVSHLAGVMQGRQSVRAFAKQAAEDCLDIIRRESAARQAALQGEDPTLARALQQLDRKRGSNTD